MAGGNKYIIDKVSGKVLAITDTPAEASAPQLPANQAIEECERIRSYLKKRWEYDDTMSLSTAVTMLLDMIETKDLPTPTEGANGDNREPPDGA